MTSQVRKNRLIVVLLVILAFNYVDRTALGLVLQQVKTDLSLSDTQLGVLTGIAFALFYSVMGIPIARWADQGNRVLIITATVALWSVAVALCGIAGSFLHLLLIRIAVAVGEAGCIPPAHSLIADYFTRAERPRAVARYMLAGPLSVVIGYFVAGWLNEIYGWRTMFIALGLPGLILAAVAWLTLKEPRLTKESHALPAADQPSLREVCAWLWCNVTFRHLLFCFSVLSFFTYGIAQWKPTFFIRSFGLQTGELGTWFAAIYGIGGILGTYLGGEWASRQAANNERLQLRAMAIAFPSLGAISVCLFLSSSVYLAFAFMALGTLTSASVSGPMLATLQTLVPDRMRAMSIALVYLFANLIGMGLGPLVAGVLSDAFRELFGQESLRYALLAMCPGYLWAAWHAWRASRTVTRDIEATRVLNPQESKAAPSHVSADAPIT